MNEAVMKFRQELNASVELQEKLMASGDFVAIAKENGHEFTEEEVKSTYEEIMDSDEGLNAFELDAVSGGRRSRRAFNKIAWWKLCGLGTHMCWVAREVYGEANPQWLLFRRWLLGDSPSWFRNLYISRGEAFANWLSRHTWLKPMIRRWMDSRIRS